MDNRGIWAVFYKADSVFLFMNPARVALFYVVLLLASPLAVAVPSEGIPPSHENNLPALAPPIQPRYIDDLYTPAQPEEKDLILSFQTLPGGGSICRFSSLSDLDVQRFKDSILVPGLVGDEVSAGTQSDTDRETISDSNVLIVPNPSDEETAFKKQIPNQILKPEELSPLQNQRIKGPFAFGLSLYDSLRAAKCVQGGPCAVQGEQLQLRNSGEGISGNVENMWDALKTDLDSPNPQFSEEESNYLQALVIDQQDLDETDANTLPVEVFSRAKGPNLLNYIQVDNTFNASILTNCSDGTCVLSLYSMFDKYFNSWFSGQLVVGTFGPTVWGQFKKMMVNSKRFNVLSGKLNNKVLFPFKASAGPLLPDGTPVGPNSAFGKNMLADKLLGGKGYVSIGGADYFRNMKRTYARDLDVGNIYKEAFIDQKVTSGGKFPSWEDSMFGPEGGLTKVTNFDDRLKLAKYTKKIGEHAQITEELRAQYFNLAKSGDKVAGARGFMRLMIDADDAINLDLKATLKALPEANFRQIKVQDPDTGLIRAITDLDDKYFDDMAENFMDKGSFERVTRLKKGPNGGIQLFEFRPQGAPVETVNFDKITNGLYPPDAQVRLLNGQFVSATPDSIPLIKAELQNNAQGQQFVYYGGFVESGEFTPADLADKVLVGDIMDGKIKNYGRNAPQVYETMIARDYAKGPYTNILSKSLQANQNLFSNYAKVYSKDILNSGIGTTFNTYAYWWGTRFGGLDQFSVYQLPDEYSEVRFVPGDSEFYNGAYIDFFANEGSDTGDLFQRVISNLPIPLIIDKVAGESDTLDWLWETVNGGSSRTNPDNLAMFLFGPQACPDCAAVIESPNKGRFDVQFASTESTNSFFLEHAKTKEAKEEGQLLITFAHKTDIKGKIKGEELSEINLVKAREDEETCEQVMDGLFVYGAASRLIGAEKVGAVLAITENVSYLAGGMMGGIVTAINQFAVAPQMNECVDDKEGYFASLFVPNKEDEDTPGKADDLQKSVTEDAIDGIREFANEIDRNRTGQSLTDNVLKEATSKVRELVDEAQEDDVAEAELRITGSSSGYVRSEEVMYFWVGGGSLVEPTQYLTDGKTLLTTEDGHTITVDNETGKIIVDGQEVIGSDKEDHTRLTNKNLAIPAMEVPQRINGFQLGDSNALLLTMNVRGETLVQDAALLDCLQYAVMEQTGVPLNSNNMGEAFGRGQSVTTDAFPSISIDTTNNRIQLGGQVPQTAFGPSASVQLYGNRRVVVTGAGYPEAGNFQSASFENGTVVYKPSTNELLIWLRHHQQAVVSDEEVKGFNGDLTSTTNPNTQCEEPAIDLSVETDPNSPAAKLKGDNLTAGLKKNGPFQVFETPTKQFILYSKLVDGECKDFFKVINKETGEVYDQEITDITQGDDGTISIKTADGQSHSLQFSDQNGKPTLTYDGNSELLNSASGKGGSFYYDPNKGLYYAENAQLIPLNDNFRNQGIGFQANPDGSVSGKAAENVFNINTGQGADGLFNIPSIPEDLAGAGLILLILIGCVLGLYVDSRKKKELVSL